MTMPEEDRFPSEHLEPEERDPEASPADAAEQARPVDPGLENAEIHRGLEVNEYDAVEQARVVPLNEEEY
jgi:hypothetical protein